MQNAKEMAIQRCKKGLLIGGGGGTCPQCPPSSYVVCGYNLLVCRDTENHEKPCAVAIYKDTNLNTHKYVQSILQLILHPTDTILT